MIAFAKPDNIIAMPTKNNEWFTPARYVEAARSVMGSIDLDPASCFEANQTVKASYYYTVGDDGLSHEWYGRVWLNPPFALDRTKPDHKRSTIAKWTQKLVSTYQQGQLTQAIMLTTAQPDAKWFALLWDYPICFTSRKVWFHVPYGSTSRHGQKQDTQRYGTIFVYLGPNNEKFAEVFSEFGPVIPANVAVRRQQITPLSLWEVSK